MLKLSVILPTRNRSASLRVFLRSVAHQNLPREDYEVIVVDDGSSDDTPAVFEERWPFTLRTIRHANKGAVESRNIAAASAGGELLVFLDDDMTLDPGYLTAILDLHAAPEPRVGMGSLLPDADHPVSRFHAMYAVLNADCGPFPDEIPASFTACVTNNVSVRKGVFFSLGGFRNPVGDGPGTWTDVEFGCRVHRAGISCWRSGRALCIHRDYSIHDFATARKRAYRVARAVPALFEAHPWVRAHLPMFHDKWPVDLRQDGPLTIARKLFRRLLSSSPALWVMERAASALPNEALLRPLYRWIFGADLYRGLRDGVSELRAASLDGGWPLWARTTSKG